MNKLTKLSLVAAVAVAGLTTSASAVNLEEAIKGVDVSGMVRYRMETADGGIINNGTGISGVNTFGTSASAGNQGNNVIDTETAHRYTAIANLAIPTGDITKTNLGFRVDGTLTDDTSDANTVVTNLTTANFQVQLANTTVIAGKQYLNTPLTHAGWDTGSGILALNKDLPVTLAAAYFVNSADTTIDTVSDSGLEDKNIAVLAAMGKLGMVDAQLWFFNIEDVANAYFVEASTAVAGIDAKAQYVSTNYDDKTGLDNDSDSHQFYALELGTKLGTASLTAAYTATGDEGGLVTIDDGHNDAALISIGEQAQAAGQTDASSYGVAVMAPVYGALSLGADVAMLDMPEGGNDLTEFVARAEFKLDKKIGLSGWVSYANLDNATSSTNEDTAVATRFEAKYKF